MPQVFPVRIEDASATQDSAGRRPALRFSAPSKARGILRWGESNGQSSKLTPVRSVLPRINMAEERELRKNAKRQKTSRVRSEL
jgi:hypothetical protein